MRGGPALDEGVAAVEYDRGAMRRAVAGLGGVGSCGLARGVRMDLMSRFAMLQAGQRRDEESVEGKKGGGDLHDLPAQTCIAR